jgi:predicted signal transduction protein with EAL and GGDEF domain
VSLDNFGTGYGSLIHLLEFPISGLKVDRSFVRDLNLRHNARVIVEVIVGLKLKLVAEAA